MQIDNMLSEINGSFANQKVFWTKDERKAKPTITDRLIHYIISYYEMPHVARKALRVFTGLENELFCSWNEVRVASIREIREVLINAGGKHNTWELAFTIKDFLQNAFDTVFTINLDDLHSATPAELGSYLKQLGGEPGALGKERSSPFRPYWSIFNRRKGRLVGEQVLPDFAIKYLKYLLGMTKTAPYDPYMDRLMLRMGVADKKDLVKSRIKKYNQFMGIHRTVRKHKKLVLLAKTVCLSKNPRCNVCPIREKCSQVGVT